MRMPVWICEDHLGRIRNECVECRIAALEAELAEAQVMNRRLLDSVETFEKASEVAIADAERAEAQVERLRDAQNPDMTNAQYHIQLGRLWSVLPARDEGTDVFDLAVETVTNLRAEVERLRKKADIADCLEEYAEHTRDCSMPRSWSPGDPDPTTKCNCGLVALELALADLDKEDGADAVDDESPPESDEE